MYSNRKLPGGSRSAQLITASTVSVIRVSILWGKAEIFYLAI